MTVEEEIKQIGLQRGAEKVGIASVAAIDKFAPAGHRPDDILPGAKSVIVFAGRVSLRGAWRSPDYRTHYLNRDFPRSRDAVAMAVAKAIETKYGYYAIGQLPPNLGLHPSLSLKLCAELAGLGTRSMAAGILLDRELGMPSLSATITTMPLRPDGPEAESICPDPACVKMFEKSGTTPCLSTCPDCLTGEIAGGRIKWMRYDRRICSTRAQNMSMGAFQRTLLEGIDEPDSEKRKTLLLGSFYRSVVDAVASGGTAGQCAECLRHCPICLRARRLTPHPLKKAGKKVS